MFSGHFCEKWVSVRESNIKLPLETVTLESASCIVPTETATCRIDYRNFHSQKWCQSETLLDKEIYNKEI